MITEIIKDKVSLRYDRQSGEYFGKCPFCKSESEVFSVDKKTDTFFCYACGTKGTEKDLCRYLYGELPNAETEDKDTAVLKAIHKDAALLYYKNLMNGNNPGMEYLKKRNIDKFITKFGLGYAPKSSAWLYNKLKQKYGKEAILKSGLVRADEDGKLYDFFRNRVMFPIINQDENVVAFGARTLSDTVKPKYINSSESEIFSKRRNLYGFPYRSKKRSDSIIICEGYMDYIAIKNYVTDDCAATLGTALTEEHAALIAKYYKNVYLSFDSDEAGINAVRRSSEILDKYGLTLKIPNYKPCKDPDEFINKNGAAAFKKRLSEALPESIFLVRNAKDREDLLNVMVSKLMPENIL